MADPAGVGAVRTCGTMRHHDGLIILPLPRLSSTVAADLVLAIRGAIRAARVSSPKATRSSLKSEHSGATTIRGMPRSAERYRRSFAARSPSAPGMEVFPGLEEDYIKNGRSHANLAGTGPELCGREEARLERNLAVIHRPGGFGGRHGVAGHRRRAVAVRLVKKLHPAAGLSRTRRISVENRSLSSPSLRHLRVCSLPET